MDGETAKKKKIRKRKEIEVNTKMNEKKKKESARLNHSDFRLALVAFDAVVGEDCLV